MAYEYRVRYEGDKKDWMNLEILFTLDIQRKQARKVAYKLAAMPEVIEIYYNRKGTNQASVARTHNGRESNGGE